MLHAQPQAAGSSLLARLTSLLVADALRIAGLEPLTRVTVLPVATGMAITLVLLALQHAQSNPHQRCVVRLCHNSNCNCSSALWWWCDCSSAHVTLFFRRVVIMSRIDQKTCYKSVVAAGCHVHIVPCLMDGDQLVTNLPQV